MEEMLRPQSMQISHISSAEAAEKSQIASRSRSPYFTMVFARISTTTSISQILVEKSTKPNQNLVEKGFPERMQLRAKDSRRGTI